MARDLKFSDPQYPKQWHLKNQRYIGNDCNVTSVWEYNITGKGVVVAVVDDGNVFVSPLLVKILSIKFNYIILICINMRSNGIITYKKCSMESSRFI